jgi:Glycosyl transferase family 2
MLYRAGFGFVYRLAPLPKHDDFRETFEHRRKRTVLLASAIPIALLGFRLCIETYEKQDPWTKVSAFPGTIPQRISRFLALPAAKKYLSLAYHARRILPGIPIPWRLPFGAWWLARDGELDHKLVEENFERAELRFVERLLRRGMSVLDIRSIVYQGYPNLEYIVVDGGSSDGTVDIIRKYEKHISWWISRRDKGVYDASQHRFLEVHGNDYGLA